MDGDGFTREVSIIIPVFNEEENINPMIQEIQEAMGDANYEILFVDDGSDDRTFEMITQAKSNEDKVRVVKHHRNMGKAIALATGFLHAAGRISITMDGDLQDDPKEIPRFIAAFEDGFNLICGWRAKRQDNASKRWPSKVYNALVRRMSGINIHDMNCGFKAYDTRLARGLHLYGDMHRYTPVLAKINGANITEIAVEHRPRVHGKSKYGSKRLLRGLFDLVTVSFLLAFLDRPLHLFGRFGAISTVGGTMICAYLLVLKYGYGEGIGERPLLALGVLLITLGIQLFLMGLLGESIAYRSSSQRDVSLFGKEY